MNSRREAALRRYDLEAVLSFISEVGEIRESARLLGVFIVRRNMYTEDPSELALLAKAETIAKQRRNSKKNIDVIEITEDHREVYRACYDIMNRQVKMLVRIDPGMDRSW